MSAVDKAVQTQLTNIQSKTGKSLEELRAAPAERACEA
jgi:hypothetical protein